jgi:single-strand DNA-binding protein
VAFESNYVTFIGNLTEDPTLRYTGNGAAVVSLRVASSRKWTDAQGNAQEDTVFMTVNAWRDLAEHAAESLNKGDRVVVIGRIRTRSYDNKDGVKVYVTEIEADEIAPSLRWAEAKVTRISRGDGQHRNARPAQRQQAPSRPVADIDLDEVEAAFSGDVPF